MAYRYRAANADGALIEGVIDAANEREAARKLRSQSLVPVEVGLADSAKAGSRRGRTRRASREEIALAIGELATLLQSGMQLAEAVASIAQAHEAGQVGNAFHQAHIKLKGGEPLSAALADCGIAWPSYFQPLLQAGEQTGDLSRALASINEQMEYDERVRQEFRNALIYPSVLVVSGIGAMLLIFIVVVPKFANLLKSTRAEIPAISSLVLHLGLFVRDNLLWVGLAVAALTISMTLLLARPDVRLRLMNTASRTPVIGPWLVQSETGRWAALLAILLGNRVTILRAMELAAEGVMLISFRQHLTQAARAVRGGRKLAEALAGSRWLDATALNLVHVGERSGSLPRMLETLAKLCENKGRQRLKRFLTLLEPAAILVIGGVIGTVMVAIMLAITSLSNISL